jgi:nicotinate-nucleotide pyrophosphorylase (carboxylating)
VAVERLTAEEMRRAVRAALDEDIAAGDVTSAAMIEEESVSRARMMAREPLVAAGLELAEIAFRELSSMVEVSRRVKDGALAQANDVLMELVGSTRALLTAERVALNFVQRLSGIATLTAKFVEAVRGTRAQILDTRKTTPGLRRLEKYAVTCGGGKNHRFGLFDMVLIKDNHLAALAREKPNAIGAAVQRARRKYPKLKVEVEADSLEQVGQALDAGADIILLDNMNVEQLRQAVHLVAGRAQTEASGGVTLGTVRAIAETGVDLISVGALTHSATAVDVGLDFL